MTDQDKLKESIRKLAREWPAQDADFFATRITAIERDLPLESNHEDAIKAKESARLARKFGFSDKGLLYLLEAESARKDFWLYDSAVKGGLFTNPPKRGFDRLSSIMLEILNQLGKDAPSKVVIEELRRIAESRLPNTPILEVDEDDSVYWLSKEGTEKFTPFRTIENRLSRLRKTI